VNVESSARSVALRQSVLRDDYMENFQPELSFLPVSQAEISARPKDNILLKHSKRLQLGVSFRRGLKLYPGWKVKVSSRLTGLKSSCNRREISIRAEKTAFRWLYFCLFYFQMQPQSHRSQIIDMNNILNSSKKRNSSILNWNSNSSRAEFCHVNCNRERISARVENSSCNQLLNSLIWSTYMHGQYILHFLVRV
jgi:hypothetical protein